MHGFQDSVRFPQENIGEGVCAPNVATPEHQYATELMIFPNPTTDGLVRVQGLERKDNISVTSADGRTLHVSILRNGTELLVDFSSVAAGLYVVHVYQGQGRLAYPVLRQ